MKSFYLLTILLFPLLQARSQVLRRAVAAPGTGIGAYSLHHVDVFSFTVNQAALAQIGQTSAGVYAERRFLLNELDHYTAVAAFKTASGNFGIKTNYSGYAGYNETQIGLGYGRKLGSKLSAGVQVNYHGMRVSNGYGTASAVSFELGAVFHLTEKINSGVHISNPVGGKFGKEKKEKLASVYSLGLGYDPSQKLLISLVFEKEENQPINVNAGFQYKFIPQLMVRAGIASATSSVWFGIGFSLSSFRIDISSSYHPQLGISPGILLLFNFKNKKM